MLVEGTDPNGNPSAIASSAEAGSIGQGGTVEITAREDLTVRAGGRIFSDTSGPGTAGTVQVQAGRLFVLGDKTANTTNISSSANPGSAGAAGTIQIMADTLELHDGGQIFSGTFAQGNAGQISVDADRVLVEGTDPAGFVSQIGSSAEAGSTGGSAGTVTVAANELELRNGGQIFSGTFAQGNAGQITVDADRVLVEGFAPDGSSSAIASSAEAGSTGQGGTVEITAREDLTVQAGGRIFSSTSGPGAAGTVQVTAGDLQLHDGGQIFSGTFTRGNGGQITVDADRLVITGGPGEFATIISSTAEAGSVGAAGTIQIMADTLELHDGGQIFSGTFAQGNAGQISVDADRVLVEGTNPDGAPSAIASSAEAGSTGQGGRVEITAQEDLTVRNGGRIFSDTSGTGTAGGVQIQAGRLFV